MHVFHLIAAFLLSLVGYAAGAVLVAADRGRGPVVWELPLAAATALAAAVLGPRIVGDWAALPLAVAGGAAVGSLAGLGLRITRRRDGTERKAAAVSPIGDPDDGPVRRFLLRLGTFQGRVTMGFLYFGLLTPFALVARLVGDPWASEWTATSYWRKRSPTGSGETRRELGRQG
ncbi:MAG: hypothetical protein R3266_08090 [Gemmatimonadota bacterium]|nr:hypothetical protein [Gemmatimonadota bacterium]